MTTQWPFASIFPCVNFSLSVSPPLIGFTLALLTLGTRGQQLLWQSKGLDTSSNISFLSEDQGIYLNTHEVPRQPLHRANTRTHACKLTYEGTYPAHFCPAIPLRLLKEKKTRFNSPENSQTRPWIVFWLDPILFQPDNSTPKHTALVKRREIHSLMNLNPKKKPNSHCITQQNENTEKNVNRYILEMQKETERNW